MGCSVFVTGLLICMVVHGGNFQTIDEIILAAQEHGSDLKLPSKDVKVELDMLFDAKEYKRIQIIDEEAAKSEGRGGRKKRKAIRYGTRKWPNGVIPYYIHEGFSQDDQAHIQAAMNDWNKHTCLTFRPNITDDNNYISIKNGTGCSSYVGMLNGSQDLTLGNGCRLKITILHELGHALGFYHEHTRPDRDEYVEIIKLNIKHGKENNFNQHFTNVINDHGVSYDYLSIMHYGKTAFGVNKTLTIRTLDDTYQDVIGTRQTLSFKDVKLANLMYKCGSHCGSNVCPGNRFVGKDCKCYCPGNPTKLCRHHSLGGPWGTARSPTCRDNKPICPHWAFKGYCHHTNYEAYMLYYCKKSCRQC